jgi:hypothetical protein
MLGSGLPAGNGEGVTGQFRVTGQQSHPLLARLNQQPFVERILVRQGLGKFGGGMPSGERKEFIASAKVRTDVGATGPFRAPEK